MNIETLSALLTLRINGPELKDFDCHKYLTDWKARGGLESDAQQPRGPGKKQDEDGSMILINNSVKVFQACI
uniref:Uncharacterized protein n=1 Tax=Panagrolaimus davidi TaxID=227884 RepID=A0A914QJA7_9BILA